MISGQRIRHVVAWWLSAMLAAAAVFAGATAPSQAADPTATLDVQKSTPGVSGPLKPGDTFDYLIKVGCSSTNTQGCTNAALSDTLPAPLIFDPAFTNPVAASVSGGGTATVTATQPNALVVKPQQSVNGTVGLAAGAVLTVTVHAKVPADISADYDGRTITNTATATADNAANKSASTDVALQVTSVIAAAIDKTASPTSTIPAVPGKPVEWTLTSSNTSNRTVDALVVQDPSAGTPSHNPWQTYLDFTGIGELTMPSGATAVQIEWADAGGVWHTSFGPGPLPADPNQGLPTDLTTVKGIRITYTGAIATGASATVKLGSKTNDQVSTIAAGSTIEVPDNASAEAKQGTTTSPLATDDAKVTISANPPTVTVTKSFADSQLISGQSTTATIHAANGDQPVHQLTITEPSAGHPGFTAQGLRFDGFGNVEWPQTATKATITYTYSGCASDTKSTTTADTLPAPTAGCTVEGYTVTFESAAGSDGIAAAAYADLPMNVTALPVTDPAGVSSTNVVDTKVTNTDGQTGTDDAEAPFTVSPLVLDTTTSKKFTPNQVWDVPGAQTTISLSGKLNDDSTVGSQYLDVTDPVDPTQHPNIWDSFTPNSVSTDVPDGLTMTPSCYNTATSAWEPLSSPVVGPASNKTIPIPASAKATCGGIRFHFVPTDPTKLIPPAPPCCRRSTPS